MTPKSKVYSRYRTKWLIPMRKFENRLILKLRKIFKNEYTYIADNYDFIAQNGFSIIRNLEMRTDVKNSLIKVVSDVIPFAGEMAYRDINREIKSDFDYGLYIAEYVASDTFRESIESIVTTFYDDIEGIIPVGIEKELTRREISSSILKAMTVKSRYRADTIAITETHRASSYASEKRAIGMQNDLGVVMYKDWIPVQDARTRSAHSAMDSAPEIPMNEMFNVGGEKMSRPNDPRGSAKNTIRCRCVLRYIIKD